MKHPYSLGYLIQELKTLGCRYLLCYPYEHLEDENRCFDYTVVGAYESKEVYKLIDELYPDAVTYVLENC